MITIAASPISLRPRNAASAGSSPMLRWRSMFSSTTVESSTRIPITSVIAISETVSIVRFIIFMMKSVTPSDVGIAIMTTIAFRHDPRKNSITIAVSTMPSISVCCTPSTCCRVYSD